MANKIQVHEVSFQYNQQSILKDMTLEIPEGTFMGIIGPNGSGKTTFLKTIAAQLTVQAGTIILDGTEIKEWKPKPLAQNLAVVPQESHVPFSYSVHDIVMMGRNPHLSFLQNESSYDYDIVERALRKTNTWHLRNRMIHELSGGERQRVILSRAIAQQPKVLLLDEPISFLDIHHQVEMMNVVQEWIREENITCICVLHDLNMAARYCDTLALLDQGSLVAVGHPDKVLTKENIKNVYRCNSIIMKHPITETPQIIVLNTQKDVESKGLRIHLICGGGKGAKWMEKLIAAGYEVTAGVLNIGDTDWEVANGFGMVVIEEEPFLPISTEANKKNRGLLQEADIVLVIDTPFGLGNLKNLQVLTEGDLVSKVAFVGQDSFAARDYTKGEATLIINELIQNGAIAVPDYKGLLLLLDEMNSSKRGGS